MSATMSAMRDLLFGVWGSGERLRKMLRPGEVVGGSETAAGAREVETALGT